MVVARHLVDHLLTQAPQTRSERLCDSEGTTAGHSSGAHRLQLAPRAGHDRGQWATGSELMHCRRPGGLVWPLAACSLTVTTSTAPRLRPQTGEHLGLVSEETGCLRRDLLARPAHLAAIGQGRDVGVGVGHACPYPHRCSASRQTRRRPQVPVQGCPLASRRQCIPVGHGRCGVLFGWTSARGGDGMIRYIP